MPGGIRAKVLPLVVGATILIGSGAGCSREITPTPVPATDTVAASTDAVPTGPTSVAPAPASDADQVRDTVLEFQDAYNTKKWDTYMTLMCTKMRDQYVGAVLDQLTSTRDAQGLTNVTVTGVDVDGDDATATLDAQNEMLGRRTIELQLIREDGWKICMWV